MPLTNFNNPQALLSDTLRGRRNAADTMSLSTLAPVSNLARTEQKRVNVADVGNRLQLRQTLAAQNDARAAKIKNAAAIEAAQAETDATVDAAKIKAARDAEVKDIDLGEAEKERQLKITLRQMQDKARAERETAKALAKDAEDEAKVKADTEAKIKTAEEDAAAPSMGMVERRKYREATTDMGIIASTIAKVEAAVASGKDPFYFGASYADLAGSEPGFTDSALDAYDQYTKTPDEKELRATVYNKAYEAIHRLAGAVMSKGETPRLNPFVPRPNDNSETILAKLRSELKYAQAKIDSFEGMYSLGATPAPSAAGAAVGGQAQEAVPVAGGIEVPGYGFVDNETLKAMSPDERSAIDELVRAGGG